MSEPVDGTRNQTPDDVRRVAPIPPRSRKLLALLVGGVLLLGLAVGTVIALLPSGNRSEPTQPSAKNDPKGDVPATKTDPKGDPPKNSTPNSKGDGSKGGTGGTPEPKKEPTKEPEPKVVLPKAGDTREIEIAPGVKMTFCWVPAGECQLGSPKGEVGHQADEDEAKRGKFRTNGFWMGKYTVTQAEWKAVMGDTPATSAWGGSGASKLGAITDTSRFPVECVSWDRICGKGTYEGKGFLDKIDHSGIPNALGKPGRFKLPTEDEWEYAARGGRGNGQPFYWGKELNGTQANCDGTFPYGTTVKGTDLGRTCAVDATDDTMGHKYPQHPWGLMHMHGNVYQWCENTYDKTNVVRVLRGGSWSDYARNSRAAYRSFSAPDSDDVYGLGFRLVVPGLP